jgi:hypothetical protein
MFGDHYIYTVFPLHLAMVVGLPAVMFYLAKKEAK